MRRVENASSRWLTTSEAARYIGLASRAALRMMIRRGRLRASGPVGRRVLFTKEDLDDQIALGTIAARPVPSLRVDSHEENHDAEHQEERKEDAASRTSPGRGGPSGSP